MSTPEIKELEARLKQLRTDAKVAEQEKRLEAGEAQYCAKCSRYHLVESAHNEYPDMCCDCGNKLYRQQRDEKALEKIKGATIIDAEVSGGEYDSITIEKDGQKYELIGYGYDGTEDSSIELRKCEESK